MTDILQLASTLLIAAPLGAGAAQLAGHARCDWRGRTGQMKQRLLVLKSAGAPSGLRRSLGCGVIGAALIAGPAIGFAAQAAAPARAAVSAPARVVTPAVAAAPSVEPATPRQPAPAAQPEAPPLIVVIPRSEAATGAPVLPAARRTEALAEVGAARAAIAEQRLAITNARRDLERQRTLMEAGFGSQAMFDAAAARLAAAEQAEAAEQARVVASNNSSEAQAIQTAADRAAQLARGQTALSRLVIMERNLERQQTLLNAGFGNEAAMDAARTAVAEAERSLAVTGFRREALNPVLAQPQPQ